MNDLLDDLLVVANEKVNGNVEVHAFERDIKYSPGCHAKGACKALNCRFSSIVLFYEETFDAVVALAHELGHINTMSKDDIRVYGTNWREVFGYERLASRWALAWLRTRLSSVDLARAESLLNSWLDSYYELYFIREENRQRVHANEEVAA